MYHFFLGRVGFLPRCFLRPWCVATRTLFSVIPRMEATSDTLKPTALNKVTRSPICSMSLVASIPRRRAIFSSGETSPMVARSLWPLPRFPFAATFLFLSLLSPLCLAKSLGYRAVSCTQHCRDVRALDTSRLYPRRRSCKRLILKFIHRNTQVGERTSNYWNPFLICCFVIAQRRNPPDVHQTRRSALKKPLAGSYFQRRAYQTGVVLTIAD